MSSDKFLDDERFDGLYMNVANTARGIEPMLDTVFSFLRRKTDFFAGPPGSGDGGTQAAVKKVNEVLKKHAELYERSQQKKKATPPKKKTVKPKTAEKDTSAGVIEMGKDGGFDVSSEVKPPTKKKTKSADDKKKADQAVDKAMADEVPPSDDKGDKDENENDDDDDRGPPPIGNGGTVNDRYTWTQTLSEVNVVVPVPDGTRGRDLQVTIAKTSLKVGLRSQQQDPKNKIWLIDSPLTKAIICDDSFWTVEDGNKLVINLQKLNQMEWWDSVCEGDPKINIRAIQPETSSLGDLEGETRKTVEKMMYDQRQKALGRPSSDEEKKLEMLEKFKQQHPELDFSNAKIS